MTPLTNLAAWYRHADQELLRGEVLWTLRWLRRPFGVFGLIAYAGLLFAKGYVSDRGMPGPFSASGQLGLYAWLLLFGLWSHIFRRRTLGPLQKDRLPAFLATSASGTGLWPGLLGAPIVLIASFALLAAAVPLIGQMLPGYSLLHIHPFDGYAWVNPLGFGLIRLGHLAQHLVVWMAITAYTARSLLERQRSHAGIPRIFGKGLLAWLGIHMRLGLVYCGVGICLSIASFIVPDLVPSRAGDFGPVPEAPYGWHLWLIGAVFLVSVPLWRRSLQALQSLQTWENLRAYAEWVTPHRALESLKSAERDSAVERGRGAGAQASKKAWTIGIAATLVLGVMLYVTESRGWLFLPTAAISSAATLPTPRAAITMDGKADDWASVPPVVMHDSSGGPWKSTRVGMQSIKLAQDDQNLYVLITLGVGIQEKFDRYDTGSDFALMFKTEGSIYRASWHAGQSESYVGSFFWGRRTFQTMASCELVQLDAVKFSEWKRTWGGWRRERRNEDGRITSIQMGLFSKGPPWWLHEPGRSVARRSSHEGPTGYIAFDGAISGTQVPAKGSWDESRIPASHQSRKVIYQFRWFDCPRI
ncbi:MAG: hypothetical protein IH892_17645 [Planctomycetes bacterium]|nr:hypothetical protein [Planctomycetota bacterium]